MTTPDIRIQASFITHHKTKKMIRKIGHQGPFCLIALWTFAATSGRTDGVLSNMDEDDIEIAADWSGDAGVFLECAVQIGFIDRAETGYQIHDWADHQPWVVGAKERSRKAREAALAKLGVEEPSKTTRSQRLAAARKIATHTDEQWDLLKKHCGGRCLCCGSEKVVKDHIMPIYQGGSDGIENLQPLCLSCNSSKGPHGVDHRDHSDEFFELIRSIGGDSALKRLLDGTGTPAASKHSSDKTPAGTPAPLPSLPIPTSPEELMAERFSAFWSAYPRKVKKQTALVAFKKINPDDELLALMIQAIERQEAEREQRRKADGFDEAWPHPPSWLNAKRWEDEPAKPINGSKQDWQAFAAEHGIEARPGEDQFQWRDRVQREMRA